MRSRNQHALEERDPHLQVTLKADAGLLEEASSGGQAAFELYCATLTVFDTGPKLERLAFRAVIEEDEATLSALLESGRVAWDARNAGGQTLLEVAHERSRFRSIALLQEVRTRTGEAPEDAEQGVE